MCSKEQLAISLRLSISAIKPGSISSNRSGSESRRSLSTTELTCSEHSEEILTFSPESAEGAESLNPFEKSLHIGFHFRYDLAGRGRLVLVGLFEC